MTSALANALFAASRAHPEQRVGQLIVNALHGHDFDDPFYMEDAELTAALFEYAREGER